MASTIQYVLAGYNTIFNELRNPRTKDWLFSSPSTVVLIVSGYLYFCLVAGPRYMEKRKPYNLKNVIIVYNLFQVLYSAFLLFGGAFAMWKKNFNFVCEEADYSDSPGSIAMIHMVWYYYFGKLTELLDTVFFVLRKKKNQITFLHLYHHSSMVFWIWIGVAYLAAGHLFFLGVLNSFVHVLMYIYYFLSGLGPQYQKYLWWKKHMTVIQLVQFVIIFIHNIIPLLSDCGYYKSLHLLACVGSSLFIYMFGKFYVQSYMKEKSYEEKLENQKNDSKTINRKAITINGKTKLDKEL